MSEMVLESMMGTLAAMESIVEIINFIIIIIIIIIITRVGTAARYRLVLWEKDWEVLCNFVIILQ